MQMLTGWIDISKLPAISFVVSKLICNYSSLSFWAGVFPSSQRRGGWATKKMSRSLRSGADGGRSPRKPDRAQQSRKGGRSQAVFRTHSEIWLASDHPVRSSKEASRYFLDVASTPPLGGGEYPAWAE